MPRRSSGLAGRAAAHVGRPREAGAGDESVGAAPVIEPGGGEVLDPATGGRQAQEPLLLVTVWPHDRLVERPDSFDRGAAHGEVRAPDHLRLAILRTQVERRDRRVLAAAAARRATLEASADRAAEGLRFGVTVGTSPRRRASPAAPARRRPRRRSGRRGPPVRRCCARRSGCARSPWLTQRTPRRSATARVASAAPSSTTSSSCGVSCAGRAEDSSVTSRYAARPRVGHHHRDSRRLHAADSVAPPNARSRGPQPLPGRGRGGAGGRAPARGARASRDPARACGAPSSEVVTWHGAARALLRGGVARGRGRRGGAELGGGRSPRTQHAAALRAARPRRGARGGRPRVAGASTTCASSAPSAWPRATAAPAFAATTA